MANKETIQNHISLRVAIPLVIFSFLVFFDLVNQYFSLDYFDILYSVKDSKLSHILLGKGTSVAGGFFRPLGMFVFWLQMELFGPNPVVYNTTVILLHALSAILAVNLLFLIFRNLRAAVIFGIIFIVFPNHTEVMNWSAIFDLWATPFYLAALNLFGYYRLSSRRSFLCMSLFSFIAAMLSKELAFTLPAVVIVFDFFFSKTRNISLPFKKRIIDYCLYFGLLLAVLVLTRTLFGIGAGYLNDEGKNFISFYQGNIYLLIADTTRMYLLSLMYLLAPISPKIPYQGLFIVLIILTTTITCILLLWKRRIDWPALVFCFFFSVITLMPSLATFRIFGVPHWGRFLYLPSVGSCYFLAVVIDGIMTRIEGTSKRYAFIGAAVFPMIFLTKFYDNIWIKTREENKVIIQTIVKELREYPKYSRIYVSGIPFDDDGIPRIGPGFPSAIGLHYDREYLQASLGFLPADRPVRLDTEQYEEGDWQYFWLVWDDKTRTLRPAKSIQPAINESSRSYTWNFTNSQTQRHLEGVNEIKQAILPGFPYPAFVIEGGWALVKLPVVNPQRPVKYLTFDMMLANEKTENEIARIFWVTEESLSYSGGRSIGFFVSADGRFHEYRIPLYRNGLSLIDPHIMRFAIRPSQTPGAFFSIRKMKVEYY